MPAAALQARGGRVVEVDGADRERAVTLAGRPAPLPDDPAAGAHSVPIDELGVEVLVGPSSVSPHAGLGVYVRTLPGVDTVLLPAGTPLFGFASAGELRPAGDGDKSVAFAVDGATDRVSVFLDGVLISLAAALSLPGVAGLAGHDVVERDAAGRAVRVRPAEGERPVVFVPAEEAWPPSIMGLGQYVNDLAVDADAPLRTAEDYEARSSCDNAFGLTWRLARRDADGVLEATRPIPALLRDTRISSGTCVEVGLAYGFAFWASFEDGRSFWDVVERRSVQ